uniref:Chromo domain-containing protein n=1 Tax=Mola mola TaxID=94237 RepID=A0A3Q3XJA4_MOLML
MEELSAVGEQVFDAECILNKRLRKEKLEFLVKWRGWSLLIFHGVFNFVCREQEKELLIRKKGKRPRGRPRKILVITKSSSSSSGSSSSCSDSSSSCSSSSSSSDDDDDDEGQANQSVRTRDLHPVPQKKAQIVVAKQEPLKKRSRKPPSPDMNNGPRKILKTLKDPDVRGAIKKPVHPASFTFMGFHRGPVRDPVGGQNRSPLTQGGAVKNLIGSVGSPSPNKSSQNRNVTEAKPSVSSMSSGMSLDLKAAASKSKGVTAPNSNTSKSPIQGNTQHTLSSPNGPKKLQAPVSTLQRMPNTKAVASFPSKNISSTQGSGLQPLNLQSKLAQNNDAAGNGPSPAAEIQSPRVQGRLEKSSMQKSSMELQQERSACKDGKKTTDMSTGEDESSSDSDQDYTGQNRSVTVQNQDWKPTRNLIEHVFVTDVTANLVTVTVKESPTSVGFFSIRNY